MLLRNGILDFNGETTLAIQRYNTLVSESADSCSFNNQYVDVIQINISSLINQQIFSGDIVLFNIKFLLKHEFNKIDVSFHIYNIENVRVLVLSSVYTENYINGNIGIHEMSIEQDQLYLIPGRYYISIGILRDRIPNTIIYLDHCSYIDVYADSAIINYNIFEGIIFPSCTVKKNR